MKTSSEWQCAHGLLPSQFFPSIRVPSSSFSSSIHSNRCTHKKKAIAAGWPKKETLGSTSSAHSLSIANPTGILSQLSFPLTTAMALDTAASLSFLLLCLKIMPTVWREENLRQVQGKIQSERTWPFIRTPSILVTINNIITRLETQSCSTHYVESIILWLISCSFRSRKYTTKWASFIDSLLFLVTDRFVHGSLQSSLSVLSIFTNLNRNFRDQNLNKFRLL